MRKLPLISAPAFVLLAMLCGAYGAFFASGFLTQIEGTARIGGAPSFDNYIRFLTDESQLSLFGYTLVFSLIVSAITIVIGYPLAYFLARSEHRRLRLLILGLLIATFMSGTVTRAYGWMVLLGNKGLLNQLLMDLGIITRPLRIIYRDAGVAIALIHFILPFFVMTVVGGIKNLPRGVEEASRDMGAGPVKTFFKVTLPLSLPAIAEGLALALALSLSAFLFPLMLGGGRVRMVANYIYEQIFVSFDMAFAAVVSVAFLVMALLTLVLMNKGQRLLLNFIAGRYTRKGEPS
ncbi:MAG TPA: ABC transporter permease [Paracoccus sp. (in: a-proteobacteria)]|uniref:ABC transporter permease n=1 Tax=Paracoccus sp. TaxID=267 RepID=UPI002BB4557D|nr:ABC transporter permease [Paracoccus sp. (in: a-proteobacteria)]HWL58877.1 ABC transporter permease [Paracoccus sp. (in: a-proteobacteria)]